jgi:hypothetical protein
VFNLFKKFLIISSLSLFTVATITVLNGEDPLDIEQPSYIESIKLDSSRYTKPDDLSLVDPDLFIDISSFRDELIAENDNLRLYYNEDIVSFKIENKNTGYVFSTSIEDVSAGTYDPLLSGGIGIEYFQVEKGLNVIENIGITDIAFTQVQTPIENGINLSLSLGGFCSSRMCKRLYPGYLDGIYTIEQMYEFGFTELEMGFDLTVTLEEDGIKAYIPYDSITENRTDEYLLSSIILFPGLGATKLDEIPGYMMIPDGAGVLVRYEDNEGRYRSPYRAQIFGGNFGLQENYQEVANYPLSMPIFGMVHGVNQNGLLGIVEEGVYSSRLYMYQNGAHNLDYNLVFPKFDIRKTFRQSFTSDGSGGAIRVTDSSFSDISVSYKVLENDQANYVGMANKYREYLEEKNTFDTVLNTSDIPLNLNYLMADSKNALLGTRLIEMSNVDDIFTMHQYFLDQGLTEFDSALLGWNDGGYSGQLPSSVDFENSLGSKNSFIELINFLKESGDVSLINNYLAAGEEADSILARRDIAKGTNRFQMTLECEMCVYQNTSLLYPETSLRLATDHLQEYQELGVNVTFESLGRLLYSYYDQAYYNREDAYEIYKQIMELYDGMANYMYPNSYAFAYASAFYRMPMFNSQVKYFDDLVPVLQIVLMGKIPMFTDYLNFNSYGQSFLLQLIDFNVYPSYLLSMNESSLLKDTDIEYLYTSEFDLWKDTVIEEYNYINDALKHVIGQSLVSREVVELGVVKNTYSNGVIIYVNYTSSNKVVDSITVEASNYALGGVING